MNDAVSFDIEVEEEITTLFGSRLLPIVVQEVAEEEVAEEITWTHGVGTSASFSSRATE